MKTNNYFIRGVITGLTLALAPITMAQNHKHHGSAMKMDKKAKKPIDDKTKGQIKEVMATYDELHKSFFNYDAKKVQSLAAQLHDSIDKIHNPEIKKLLTYSNTKLAELKSSSDRDKSNQIYNTVSMTLIHVLSTYDTGLAHQPYYCPMVKKKWIQNPKNGDKVENPYASNMPHCGGVDTM